MRKCERALTITVSGHPARGVSFADVAAIPSGVEAAARGIAGAGGKVWPEVEPRTQMAPDPDIRGLLTTAITSRYMQGRIDGIPVVAFEYAIGWGRGRKIGSCAGVQRRGLQVTPPSFAPVLQHEGDWTFVHSFYAWWWRGRYLNADEIEQLWAVLLHAPGDGSEMSLPVAEVPGGIVIRPARRI